MSFTKLDLIKFYNNCSLQLVISFAAIRPKSMAAKHLSLIKKAYFILKNDSDYIDIFVDKMLKHKDVIDKRDDNFFLSNPFNKEGDIDKDKKEDTLSVIKEINKEWPTLCVEDKDTIWEYVGQLCMFSEEYFLLCCQEKKDKENKIKNMFK
jgi:hypothetical protein